MSGLRFANFRTGAGSGDVLNMSTLVRGCGQALAMDSLTSPITAHAPRASLGGERGQRRAIALSRVVNDVRSVTSRSW